MTDTVLLLLLVVSVLCTPRFFYQFDGGSAQVCDESGDMVNLPITTLPFDIRTSSVSREGLFSHHPSSSTIRWYNNHDIELDQFEGVSYSIISLCLPLAIVQQSDCPTCTYSVAWLDLPSPTILSLTELSITDLPSSCISHVTPRVAYWNPDFTATRWSLVVATDSVISLHYVDHRDVTGSFNVVDEKEFPFESSHVPKLYSVFYDQDSLKVLLSFGNIVQLLDFMDLDYQSFDFDVQSNLIGAACDLDSNFDSSGCFVSFSSDSSTNTYFLNTTTFETDQIINIFSASTFFTLYPALTYIKSFPSAVSDIGETVFVTGSVKESHEVLIELQDHLGKVLKTFSRVVVDYNSFQIPEIPEEMIEEGFLGGNSFTTTFSIGNYDIKGPSILIAPKITGIEQSDRHHTFGGSVIDIYGQGFRPQRPAEELYVFAFLDGLRDCTFTRYISFEQITCTVPEGYGGPWNVAVRIGQAVSNTSSEFQVLYEPPIITSFSPTVSQTQGGIYMDIYGLNFGSSSAPRTAFIGPFPCDVTRFVSHTRLRCLSSTGAGKDLVVSVDVGNVTSEYSMDEDLFFSFVEPSVIFVSRKILAYDGGSVIQISGSNFGDDPKFLNIMIGDQFPCINPTFTHHHYAFSCTTTPGSGIDLDITIDVQGQGVRFPADLRYERPVVYEIVPTESTYNPSNTIEIIGRNFGHLHSEILVLFGDKSAEYERISDNKLIATVPWLASPEIFVVVETDKQRSSRNITFSTPPPEIHEVSTLTLPTNGGNITIHGYNLFGDSIELSLDEELIYPVENYFYIENEMDVLTFEIHEGVGNDLELFLTVSSRIAKTFSPLPEVLLFSYEPPVITMVEPLSGSPDFVSVEIDGLNFGIDLAATPSDFVSVKIGDFGHCQTVSFSGSRIVCDYVEGGGKYLPIIVTVAGQDSDPFSSTFSFDNPIVTSVNPQIVGTDGTQQISLFGTNFGHLDTEFIIELRSFDNHFPQDPISCFNHRRWSFGEISCFFEPSVGTNFRPFVKVEGLSNEETIQEHPETLISFELPVINSVSPNIGPTAGIDLTITGSNLGNDKSFVIVNVGEFPCDVTKLSSSELTCTLSPGHGDSLLLSVSVAGQEALSPRQLFYSYFTPVVAEFYPKEVVTEGEEITFVGSNFGQFPQLVDISFVGIDSKAREFRIPCSVQNVEDSLLTCILEPGIGLYLVPELDFNGHLIKLYNDTLSFKFPVFDSIDVIGSLSASGNQNFILFGSNFSPGFERFYHFYIGNIPVTNVEISSTSTLTITTPSLIGEFNLALVLFDYVIFANDIVLSFEPPVLDSIITPIVSQGSHVSLEILGENFPDPQLFFSVTHANLKVSISNNSTQINCLNPLIKSTTIITCIIEDHYFINPDDLFDLELILFNFSLLLPNCLSFEPPIIDSLSQYFDTSSRHLFLVNGENFGNWVHNVQLHYGDDSLCSDVTIHSNSLLSCKPKEGLELPSYFTPQLRLNSFNADMGGLFTIVLDDEDEPSPLNSLTIPESLLLFDLNVNIFDFYCIFSSLTPENVTFSSQLTPQYQSLGCQTPSVSGIYNVVVTDSASRNDSDSVIECPVDIGVFDVSSIEPNFLSNSGGKLTLLGNGLVPDAFHTLSAKVYSDGNHVDDLHLKSIKITSTTSLEVEFPPFSYTSLNQPILRIQLNEQDGLDVDLPILDIFNHLPIKSPKTVDSYMVFNTTVRYLNYFSSVNAYFPPLLKYEIKCENVQVSLYNTLELFPEFDFSISIPSEERLQYFCRDYSKLNLTSEPNVMLSLSLISSINNLQNFYNVSRFEAIRFYPDQAPSTGNIPITIFGDLVYPSFCDGTFIEGCPVLFFGYNISVPLVPGNETGSLSCIVPPLFDVFPDYDLPIFFSSPYMVPLRVSYSNLFEQSFEFDQLFEFFADFHVDSVFPLSSDLKGGVEVVFEGTSLGLITPSIVSIQLSNEVVVSEFSVIDSNSFSLTTPPSFSVGFLSNIIVTVNEIVILDFSFQYFDFEVFNYYPTSSRVDFPTPIEIHGQDFPDLSREHIICKWGDLNPTTLGTFHNSSLVYCRVPDYTIVEQDVLLYLSLDGGSNYEYVGPFFIEPSGAEECRSPNAQITTNDFSDLLSVGSFDFIQKRAFRVVYNLPNIAIGSQVDPYDEIFLPDHTATIANFSALTDGDRCCLKTPQTLGKCGVEFTTPNYVSVVLKLDRPAAINNIITAWENPCYCQPVTFTISSRLNVDYRTNENLNPSNWTFHRIHYTGRGSLPPHLEFTNPRVCPHIVGDSNDVALCLDPFREAIVADEILIEWDNRLESRQRGWLLEIETEGMFLNMPFKLYVDQPSIYVDTDFDVLVPFINVTTLNYLGENLAGLETSYDLVCVSMFDSSNNDVSYLITTERCSKTNFGNVVFDSIRLSSPPHGDFAFVFSSDTVYYNASIDLKVEFGPPRFVKLHSPIELIQVHTFFNVSLDSDIYLAFEDADHKDVDLSKADFSMVYLSLRYLDNLNDTDEIVYSISDYSVENFQDDLFMIPSTCIELSTPPIGFFEITFSTDSTYNETLIFEILPGAPDHITAEIFDIIENDVPIEGLISASIRDFMDNIIEEPPLVIKISAINTNNSVILLSNDTDSTVNGIATFDDLVITTLPSTFVDLTFYSTEGITPATITDIPVKSCPMWMVGTCSTTHCECQCIAGAYSIDDPRESVFDSMCRPCSRGTFKEFPGDGTCTPCSAALTTREEGSVLSTECYCPGTQYLQVETECLPCPEGLLCLDGQPNGTVPGYWSSSFDSPNAYQCITPYCLGRNDPSLTNDDVCEGGHSGPLCQVCADGYTLMSNACSPCNDSVLIDILILVVIVVLIFGYLIVLIRGSRNPRSTQSLYMRILTNHTQVLSSVGDFGVRWPGALRALFGISEMAGGTVELKALGCTFKMDFFSQSIAYYLLPFFILIILLAWYAPKSIIKKDKYLNDPAKKRSILARTFGRAVLAVFYFLYTLITKRALMSLHCVNLDGSLYLQSDMSVECESPEYVPFQRLSWGALIVYGFGIPCYFFYMLFRDRNEGMKRVDGSVPPSRFLRSGYTNEFYFWEILIMVRKFIITLLVVYLPDNVGLQIIVGIYLFIMWILAQVFCKPFTDSLAHALELLSLSVLFSTLVGSLSFVEEEDYSDVVVIVLFIVNLATLVILGHVLFKLFGIKIRRFFLNRQMKKGKVSGQVTELTTLKMIANPLHRLFEDSDSEPDEEMQAVRQALQVADSIATRKQGPYTLFSEDIVRLKMVDEDVNTELLEDVALEFSSTAIGIVDVTLSFANTLVPPQTFTLQISELEVMIRLKKKVIMDFLELDPANVLKYIRLYFRW
ncbi:hypothetical protein P9112_012455 [Eukaryota sp. TZLM1-RC]